MQPSATHSDSVPTASQPTTLPSVLTNTHDIGLLSHYSALPHAEGAGLMTTLDLSLRANVLIVQQALAGESESLWDCKPERIIRVSDLIAHYTEAVDEETGGTRSGPMLTLIGPDGVFHTGSQFAFRALQTIALLTGRPPWNPPVAIRAQRCTSRNKKQYQSILLA